MLNKLRRFTFVELILLLMLLVFIISALIPFYFYETTVYQNHQEQNDILVIGNALKFYKLDNGVYPTPEQGLDALVTKPQSTPIPSHWIQYLTLLPKDSWGRTYQYCIDPKKQKFKVFSCGLPKAKQSVWYRIRYFFKSVPLECQLMDKKEHL